MTDRRRLHCLSQALYVWRHDEPAAIIRHAAVKVECNGLLGRAADCTLPPPMRLVLDGAVSGIPESMRVAAARAGDTVLAEFQPQSYARLAQPSELRLDRSVVLYETNGTARVTGSINGETLTSSELVYWSSSMAEHVSSLLRRSVRHLEAEVPDSYRLLLEALGPLVVEVDVDGELFALRGGSRLDVSDGPAKELGAGRRLPSRDPDLLDAKMSLDEAVEAGTVVVQGSLTTSASSRRHAGLRPRGCSARRSRPCSPRRGRGVP